jgi:hypothetical protein
MELAVRDLREEIDQMKEWNLIYPITILLQRIVECCRAISNIH